MLRTRIRQNARYSWGAEKEAKNSEGGGKTSVGEAERSAAEKDAVGGRGRVARSYKKKRGVPPGGEGGVEIAYSGVTIEKGIAKEKENQANRGKKKPTKITIADPGKKKQRKGGREEKEKRAAKRENDRSGNEIS